MPRSDEFREQLGKEPIEHAGPQNHRADRALVAQRYEEAFGSKPW